MSAAAERIGTVAKHDWADAGAMFRDLIARGGTSPVFKARRGGDWVDVGWHELGAAAEAAGLACLARGLAPGDAIVILSGTRWEWMAADMGAIGAGLVSAGIYPTEPPAKVAYIVNDSRARIAFVDTAAQVAKLQAARADCPTLELVVVTDPGAVPGGDPRFISLDAFLAEGRAVAGSSSFDWAADDGSVDPETTAMLIYTSGTTGPPKGAMIPHRALTYQAAHEASQLRTRPGWIRPAYLPLCHVAERMFTYGSMAGGVTCAFLDGPGELMEAMPGLRPQLFIGVPRVYEKLQATAQAWIGGQPAGRRAALLAAQARAMAAGGPEGLPAEDRAAIDDIRRAVGLDRAEVLISGGASCTGEIGQWQAAIGAPARNLYGMTECGMIAINFDDWGELGLVGKPQDYAEVRLDDSGEILVRGHNVFNGYLNLPEKTAEALQGGWFHTGDIGRFDDEGRLILVDRIKDLIISSGAKNISPSAIEGALKTSPYIADAAAVGDGRNFLTALIIIDPAQVGEALAARGEPAADFAEMANAPTTRALVQDAIDTANRGFSRAESVRAFRIIPRELTPADDVLTPTLKIKRKALVALFADLVEDMYPLTERAAS